jgi:hypothetical protein
MASPYIYQTKPYIQFDHMKKSPFLLLILLATACQKELSSDLLEPGVAGNIQGLLQKVEVIDIPQNRVYISQLFSYDETGKTQRITSSTNFSSGGSSLNGIGTATFARDAQGRATSILMEKDNASITAVLNYQGSTIKLNYIKNTRNQGSSPVVLDSMVFTYNSQDQIARADQYTSQAGGQLKKIGYQEFSWDTKGNLLSKQTYQDNDGDGVFEASIKYSWTYDDKPNPRQYNDPAIFYWSTFWPTGGSANNVIKQMNDYPVNGGPDDELNYTFQYNPDNKPVTETQALSNSMTKYYYY